MQPIIVCQPKKPTIKIPTKAERENRGEHGTLIVEKAKKSSLKKNKQGPESLAGCRVTIVEPDATKLLRK
jgi:hypothetical protein